MNQQLKLNISFKEQVIALYSKEATRAFKGKVKHILCILIIALYSVLMSTQYGSTLNQLTVQVFIALLCITILSMDLMVGFIVDRKSKFKARTALLGVSESAYLLAPILFYITLSGIYLSIFLGFSLLGLGFSANPTLQTPPLSMGVYASLSHFLVYVVAIICSLLGSFALMISLLGFCKNPDSMRRILALSISLMTLYPTFSAISPYTNKGLSLIDMTYGLFVPVGSFYCVCKLLTNGLMPFYYSILGMVFMLVQSGLYGWLCYV